MVRNVFNSAQSWALFAAFGISGLVGCGSEAGSGSTSTESSSEATGPGLKDENVGLIRQKIGSVTGHFDHGHVSFGPVQDVRGPGALAPAGFGTFTQSLVSFDTGLGDGTGTGSCTSTQYCAIVYMTNNTGRVMQNAYVEITNIFGEEPTGSAISWAGSAFTRSSAYASVFVNSGNVQAADYGNFTDGQTKYSEFKFNVGSATNFYFNVAVYATFPRSFVSGNSYHPTGINACATAGNTLLTASDDAEIDITLPFPHTLLDVTYDRAVISSNGYVLFYSTGGTAPSLSQNNTSFASDQPQGYYVFWDDLAYDSGDGVCLSVVGTTPNRLATITWANAKIATSQPGKSTFSTEKITYSLILSEATDNFQYVYNLPSGGITNLTRGSSATTGFVAISGGSQQINYFSYLNPSGFIPSSSSEYPFAAVGSQYFPNP